MKTCHVCGETESVTLWMHPENGTGYYLCPYCLSSLVGVCAECDALLVKLDPIGVNKEGKRICYKCSAMHDMADDEV